MILIGIALLLIAGVLLYISLNQPRVYTDTPSEKITVTEKTKAEETETEAEHMAQTQKNTEKSYSYPINLNTASMEELMSIDGLGEARAGAIIEYREYLGKYDSVKQITEIQGIDEEIYNKVAGYLTV